MLKVFNRPISPHFTIYLLQNSSLFSIWHRISGILLSISLYFSLYLLKFFAWWISFTSSQIFTFLIYLHWFSILYLLLFFLSLLYHLINGLRYIINDFQIF